MTDPALQALLDKLQIAELLTRYLRSVDRGDIDTLRACYLPGATEDHGVARLPIGTAGPLLPPAAASALPAPPTAPRASFAEHRSDSPPYYGYFDPRSSIGPN